MKDFDPYFDNPGSRHVRALIGLLEAAGLKQHVTQSAPIDWHTLDYMISREGSGLSPDHKLLLK